jgi:spore germination protein KB
MKIKRPLLANSIEGGKISLQQLFLLNITFVISTADIFLPNFVADIAKEDAWLSVIIATGLAVISVWVATKLQIRMGQRNIVDANDQLLGHLLGRIISILIIAELLITLILVLRQTDEIMINVFLPSTPTLAIIILMMLIVIYGAHHGLEVLCRANEILIPFAFLTLIFIALANITDIQFKNFLPILYNGISPVLHATVLIYAALGQVILVILMAGSHLRTIDNRLTQVGVSSVLTLGIMMLIGVLAIAIFGAEHTAQMKFPALEMVRNIDLHNFIQRLDALVLGIWVGGIAIKLVATFYFCVVIFRQWFRIEQKKKYIYALLSFISIILASVMFQDMHMLVSFGKGIYPLVQSLLYLILPVILLLISHIRNIKSNSID